ncbi:hypothetical protein GCM10009839_30300 [Catenulispora yoronensis]|uniref:Secreted protein n=1 Tax=Catenulispora yoronensis TaxID=450799 RepID=A0ABN2U440_9ACTN
MIVAGSVGAHAASAATPSGGKHPPKHFSVTAQMGNASPNGAVVCDVQAVTPFKLTPYSAIYAQGKINSCSAGAAQCHRIVYLQQFEDGVWQDRASKDDGWRSCDNHLVSAPYNCLSVLNDYDFRTFMSVALVTVQGTTGSAFGWSDPVTYSCE